MNNKATHAASALYGTKTAENLRMAFSREAENFAKGKIFSSIARDEADDSAKRLFDEHSDHDRRHAELWLGYLDEISDTVENLAELSLFFITYQFICILNRRDKWVITIEIYGISAR